MNKSINQYNLRFLRILSVVFLVLLSGMAMAQEEGQELVEKEKKEKDTRPVRSTFADMTLIDNQTVDVPAKKNI